MRHICGAVLAMEDLAGVVNELVGAVEGFYNYTQLGEHEITYIQGLAGNAPENIAQILLAPYEI